MSYQTIRLADTSAIGVNSDNVISGGNWVGNVYTGAGEQNDYTYVGVNLQTDEAGTLTFEFSQDGVNWSKYPVTEFSVAAGINEVHGAWKGTRWVRPKFTGTGGRSFFRLRTMYSDVPITLTAPLNQSIGSDQDATVVRAVGVGEDPVGSYQNEKTDGLGFSTTSTLTANEVFNSGVLSLEGYTQVSTSIVADQDGTINLRFYSDAAGTDELRALNIPYTGDSGYKLFSAPAFTPFVEYSFTNGPSAQGDFYYDTKFTTKGISGQLLGVEDFIASGMVANLGRNIIVGQVPDGNYANQKVDGVAFRTEAPLGIGGVYTSPVTPTEGYSQIETHLYSDVAGTVIGRWYNDASKTNLLRTFTRPYAGAEVGSVSYFSSPVFGPYLEYEYTNGGTGQAEFFLDFHPRTKGISGQVLGMTDFIPSGVVANLGRSVIAGEKPGDNNLFNNVQIDSESRLSVDVPRSAFGELQTANLTPVIQVSFPYTNINNLVWTQTLSATADISSVSSVVSVSAGNVNSSATLQTIRSHKYRPGQGSVVRFTSIFTTPAIGSAQEIGLGDNVDGFFFCTSGTDYGINRRRGGVDNITLQSDWNLDRADGTQVLPVIDFEKGNVHEIQYQWLGFGAITYKVEDPRSGKFVPVHRDEFANTDTLPSVFNPTLPLRLYAENTTKSTPTVIKASSMATFTEGEVKVTGPSFNTQGTTQATGTTPVFGLTIENKTTYSGVDNRVPVALKSLYAVNDNSRAAIISVYKDVDTSGYTTFTDVNTLDSVVQVASLETTTYPASALAFSTAAGANNSTTLNLPDQVLYPGENLAVVYELPGAGTGDVIIGFNWQEDI
jgi:hypothetical protein